MIDPFKDKFAYFKDNIQTAEDKVRVSRHEFLLRICVLAHLYAVCLWLGC